MENTQFISFIHQGKGDVSREDIREKYVIPRRRVGCVRAGTCAVDMDEHG
jgi:hypothetical protein